MWSLPAFFCGTPSRSASTEHAHADHSESHQVNTHFRCCLREDNRRNDAFNSSDRWDQLMVGQALVVLQVMLVPVSPWDGRQALMYVAVWYSAAMRLLHWSPLRHIW